MKRPRLRTLGIALLLWVGVVGVLEAAEDSVTYILNIPENPAQALTPVYLWSVWSVAGPIPGTVACGGSVVGGGAAAGSSRSGIGWAMAFIAASRSKSGEPKTATCEPLTLWHIMQVRSVGIFKPAIMAFSRSAMISAGMYSLPAPWHFSH